MNLLAEKYQKKYVMCLCERRDNLKSKGRFRQADSVQARIIEIISLSNKMFWRMLQVKEREIVTNYIPYTDRTTTAWGWGYAKRCAAFVPPPEYIAVHTEHGAGGMKIYYLPKKTVKACGFLLC